MRGDVDRLFSGKIAKISDLVGGPRHVIRRRVIDHIPQNDDFSCLVSIEAHSGVPCAMQESNEHEQGTATEERATRPGALVWQVRFHGIGSGTPKVFPQSPSLAKERDDQQGSGRIGQYACPSNHCKRTVRKADVMNQKYSDRK